MLSRQRALQSTPIGNEILTYLKVRYRRFIYCSILHEDGYRLLIIFPTDIYVESKDFDIQIHVMLARQRALSSNPIANEILTHSKDRYRSHSQCRTPTQLDLESRGVHVQRL